MPSACAAACSSSDGLAYARLADEREHAAAALSRLGEHPVQCQALIVAAQQHAAILPRLGGAPDAMPRRPLVPSPAID
jgi:hypothetical protein